jgi:hypothetical protein
MQQQQLKHVSRPHSSNHRSQHATTGHSVPHRHTRSNLYLLKRSNRPQQARSVLGPTKPPVMCWLQLKGCQPACWQLPPGGHKLAPTTTPSPHEINVLLLLLLVMHTAMHCPPQHVTRSPAPLNFSDRNKKTCESQQLCAQCTSCMHSSMHMGLIPSCNSFMSN